MIKSYLKKNTAKFEAHYGYDASYLRDIIEADTKAGVLLGVTMNFLRQDFGAPAELIAAAKLRSTLRADCGPCLRLNISIAEEKGVSRDAIRTALGASDRSEGAALGARFADAVLDNSPELPELSDVIKCRFGASALYGLAIAVNAGQFYPMLKRAMGHAATCEPVVREYLGQEKLPNLVAETGNEQAA